MMKGLFEKSDDTKIIESLLRECEVNDVVTYEAMDKAIGRSSREFGNIQTALRSVLKEGLVFDSVRSVGYKRLDDSGKLKKSQGYVRRSKNSARRSIRTLEQVNYDSLSITEKATHCALAMRAKVIEHFGGQPTQNKLEDRIKHDPKVLPIGETLKFFSS